MRTFVMGDIHGAHLALQQCLERSGFDREKDTLIQLGDVADGWSYVKECVNILLSIPSLIAIKGNHDEWFSDWMEWGNHPVAFTQGGEGTLVSYLRGTDKEDSIWNHGNGFMHSLILEDIPNDHFRFFRNQELYYHDTDRNYFFCHAGWDRHTLVKRNREICPHEFYWTRELWKQAMSAGPTVKLKNADGFDTIFIGHTATTNYGTKAYYEKHGLPMPKNGKIDTPMYMGGVWNLDTGSGWSGKLTIMDIDTKEYWQSDNVEDLYPDDLVKRVRR
jgi:serine/threonine protein phosphatase 1